MTTKPIRVLFDPHGGDDSPLERNIAALATVYNEFKEEEVRFTVVGNEVKILDQLRMHGLQGHIKIVNVHEVFSNHGRVEDYEGKTTTISKLAEMLNQGEGDVLFSNGNTTATVRYLTEKCKFLVPYVRPNLLAQMPKGVGSYYYLTDAGAVKNAKPKHLIYNALLASLYLKKVKGIEHPRVGLLEGPLANEAVHYLGNAREHDKVMSYVGIISPSEIYDDVADVVVSDGFNGNLYLKAVEASAVCTKERIKGAKKKQMLLGRKELFSSFFAPNSHGYERLRTLETNGYRLVPVENLERLREIIQMFPYDSRSYNAGVLSNGEEAPKGNQFAQDMAEMLRNSNCRYIGFVEPEDVLKGKVFRGDEYTIDLVFTQTETAELFADTIAAAEKAFLGIVEPIFKPFDLLFRKGKVRERYEQLKQNLLNKEHYDRAPVLGINGNGIVGHGADDQKGTEQGLRYAIKFARSGFTEYARNYLQERKLSTADR